MIFSLGIYYIKMSHIPDLESILFSYFLIRKWGLFLFRWEVGGVEGLGVIGGRGRHEAQAPSNQVKNYKQT